jgi:hypothetical protein
MYLELVQFLLPLVRTPLVHFPPGLHLLALLVSEVLVAVLLPQLKEKNNHYRVTTCIVRYHYREWKMVLTMCSEIQDTGSGIDKKQGPG